MSASTLIAAVHGRRSLWDPADVNHHNRYIVSSLWHEVGRELGIPPIQAKSKWRGLRDYYRQMRRRKGDQPLELHQSSWAHFTEMSFLEGTLTKRRSGLDDMVKDEPHFLTEMHVEEDQSWADEDNHSENWPEPVDPNVEHFPSRCPDSANVDIMEDDDLSFFKSLLPDLRNLPRPKKLLIRLKIQELIYTEIYCKEMNDSSHSQIVVVNDEK